MAGSHHLSVETVEKIREFFAARGDKRSFIRFVTDSYDDEIKAVKNYNTAAAELRRTKAPKALVDALKLAAKDEEEHSTMFYRIMQEFQ